MKRISIALAGMLCLGLGMASAQIIQPMQFTCNNPFYVGDTQLPAGTYQIVPTEGVHLFEIRGVANHDSVFFMTMPMRTAGAEAPEASSVMFDRYGRSLILKNIVEADEVDGATLLPSSVEKRAHKEFGPAAKVVIPATRVSRRA